MKTIYLSLLLMFAISFFASCSSKKQELQRSEKQEFQTSLTREDTTAMLSLCDSCMELLKNNEMGRALDMLCEYDDSTKEINPLSDQGRQIYSKKFSFFPVLDYGRSYYSFQLEGLNDVKYEVTFREGPDGRQKTAYMFNPVRVEGKWYLCVKNADDEIDELKR